jgi:hypothetical protein
MYSPTPKLHWENLLTNQCKLKYAKTASTAFADGAYPPRRPFHVFALILATPCAHGILSIARTNLSCGCQNLRQDHGQSPGWAIKPRFTAVLRM